MSVDNPDLLDLLQPALPLPDDVMAGAEQAAENADTWWRSCAERGIRHLAAQGQPFTADDLRKLGVPEPDHPNRWGGLWHWARAAHLIEPTGGVRPSTTGSRRGGLVREWRAAA